MTEPLREEPVSCPCCGETFTVLIDITEGETACIQDCEVCCRPIVMHVSVDPDGGILVSVAPENDQA